MIQFIKSKLFSNKTYANNIDVISIEDYDCNKVWDNISNVIIKLGHGYPKRINHDPIRLIFNDNRLYEKCIKNNHVFNNGLLSIDNNIRNINQSSEKIEYTEPINDKYNFDDKLRHVYVRSENEKQNQSYKWTILFRNYKDYDIK